MKQLLGFALVFTMSACGGTGTRTNSSTGGVRVSTGAQANGSSGASQTNAGQGATSSRPTAGSTTSAGTGRTQGGSSGTTGIAASSSGGTSQASGGSAGGTTGSTGSSGGTSPNCTVIMTAGQQLTDGQGHVWSVSAGIVLENGTHAGLSANVIELAYVNGEVYQENNAGGWWGWSGGTWVASADPVASGCPTSTATSAASSSAGSTSSSSSAGSTSSASAGSTSGATSGSGTGSCNPGYLAVGTTCVDDPTGATPTFQDGFGSLSLHEYVQPGDNWALISPSTPDGRGGVTDNEQGDQWWTNPFNPATPIQGLYLDSNGQMELGLLPTPPADSAYVNSQSGSNLPYAGTLMNSAKSLYQMYGYFEVDVAVDDLPGFSFQACLESWELSGSWPPEIDIRIYADGSGAQWLLLAVDTNSGALSQTTPIDARMHAYGIDWESNFITFYIDDAQVFQVPTPTDGTYTSYPCFWYLLTGANYINLNVDPDPASLPVYAHVGSVTVFANKPF